MRGLRFLNECIHAREFNGRKEKLLKNNDRQCQYMVELCSLRGRLPPERESASHAG